MIIRIRPERGREALLKHIQYRGNGLVDVSETKPGKKYDSGFINNPCVAASFVYTLP
jgi:hypothetical protein